jgi:hypothetical protein
MVDTWGGGVGLAALDCHWAAWPVVRCGLCVLPNERIMSAEAWRAAIGYRLRQHVFECDTANPLPCPASHSTWTLTSANRGQFSSLRCEQYTSMWAYPDLSTTR